MADHLTRSHDEFTQRLNRVINLSKEAKRVVDQAHASVETQLARPDYAAVDDSLACSQAGDILEAAKILFQEAYDELTLLKAPAAMVYRTEVRVGFPYGVTHFVVENTGAPAVGRVTLYGRNDTPTSLLNELFEVGDAVFFLASNNLNAADLNVAMTVASITGNVMEFTAAFSAAPTAGNDTGLHMVLRTRHV